MPTIEEIEALFTPEIIERLAVRVMDIAGIKPNKHPAPAPSLDCQCDSCMKAMYPTQNPDLALSISTKPTEKR